MQTNYDNFFSQEKDIEQHFKSDFKILVGQFVVDSLYSFPGESRLPFARTDIGKKSGKRRQHVPYNSLSVGCSRLLNSGGHILYSSNSNKKLYHTQPDVRKFIGISSKPRFHRKVTHFHTRLNYFVFLDHKKFNNKFNMER